MKRALRGSGYKGLPKNIQFLTFMYILNRKKSSNSIDDLSFKLYIIPIPPIF